MSQRRPIHDRLFRAVVVMGAALGTSACYEHGSSPPAPPDARVADASPNDGVSSDVPVDVILII
jgi:hypothetical protein